MSTYLNKQVGIYNFSLHYVLIPSKLLGLLILLFFWFFCFSRNKCRKFYSSHREQTCSISTVVKTLRSGPQYQPMIPIALHVPLLCTKGYLLTTRNTNNCCREQVQEGLYLFGAAQFYHLIWNHKSCLNWLKPAEIHQNMLKPSQYFHLNHSSSG